MANRSSRRSTPLLSVGLFGAGAWFLASQGRSGAPAFVTAPKASTRTTGRVALRGFKEDFEAWRSSLTDEERSMIQTQAQKEFDKKFRKSDEFKKDLPDEKVQAFAKVLEKFFEAEGKDAPSEDSSREPEYDAIRKKASQGSIDFRLKNRIVEVNRDADRRYKFAAMRIEEAKRKGELYPQSSPWMEKWVIQNNDTQSHENALKVLNDIKKMSEDPNCPEHLKSAMADVAKRGIPEMGQHIEVAVPHFLANQIGASTAQIQDIRNELVKTESEEAIKKLDESIPEVAAGVHEYLVGKWMNANLEVENDVKVMKDFYKSQKDMPGKTKADVLKEIWEELPKVTDQPIPPLDEEMLAELAQEPANIEGEFRHNWGTADKLWKSEAIDAFGTKYLLGVFETKDEAQKAFTDWNGEYEKARGDMKAELEQWGKREQARLDKDTVGAARIKEILEQTKG